MGIYVRKVKKRKYAKETNTIAAETPIRAKLCRSTAGLVLEYPTIYKYNKIYIVLKLLINFYYQGHQTGSHAGGWEDVVAEIRPKKVEGKAGKHQESGATLTGEDGTLNGLSYLFNCCLLDLLDQLTVTHFLWF